MRRIALFIFLFLLISLLSRNVIVSSTKAQDSAAIDPSFDYDRAYQDYVYMGNVYRKAYDDYEIARNQYLKFETLTSRAKAQEKTYGMLKARDDVLGAYLTAIRMRLVEAIGLVEDERAAMYSQIDPEVAWYIEHRNNYKSTDTLDDLVRKSDEASDHYKYTEVVIYQTLSLVYTGKIYDLHNKTSGIVTELEAKVAEIKEDDIDDGGISERRIYLIERWIEEMKDRMSNTIEKLEIGKSYYGSKSKIKEGIAKYRSAGKRIEEGRLLLLEANSFSKEIVREIKTVR